MCSTWSHSQTKDDGVLQPLRWLIIVLHCLISSFWRCPAGLWWFAHTFCRSTSTMMMTMTLGLLTLDIRLILWLLIIFVFLLKDRASFCNAMGTEAVFGLMVLTVIPPFGKRVTRRFHYHRLLVIVIHPASWWTSDLHLRQSRSDWWP